MIESKTPKSRNVAAPSPGFFRTKLVKNGPYVPGRIVYDPLLGWFAVINGERVGPAHHDPLCADGVSRLWYWGVFIEEDEYNYLLARKLHYERVDPKHPAARPRQAIDFNKVKPEF